MVFRVKYRNLQGKIVDEVFQAPNKTIVFYNLQKKGVLPIEILEQEEGFAVKQDVAEAKDADANSPRSAPMRIPVIVIFVLLVLSGVAVGMLLMKSSGSSTAPIEKQNVGTKAVSMGQIANSKKPVEIAPEMVRQGEDMGTQGSSVPQDAPSAEKAVAGGARAALRERMAALREKREALREQREEATVARHESEVATTDSQDPMLAVWRRNFEELTDEAEKFKWVQRAERQLRLANSSLQRKTMTDDRVRQMTQQEYDGYSYQISECQERCKKAESKVDLFLSLLTEEEYERYKSWASSVDAANSFRDRTR